MATANDSAARRAFQRGPWHADGCLALIDESERWSYAGLTAAADERYAKLRRAGLRPGEVVLVPERPIGEFSRMQWALARAGAVLQPLPADADAAERDRRAQAVRAEWLWQPGGPAPGRLHRLTAGPPRRVGSISDLALIVETSGSTGRAKSVLLTASNILHSAEAVNHRLGLETGDRWLCCLPRTHVGGLAIGYRCALAGAAQRIVPDSRAETLARVLSTEPITHLSLVPPQLARLLDAGITPPPTLRVALIGGQALQPPLAQRALDAGWPLHVTYGMTETGSQIATSDRLTAPPAVGSVGRLLPGVEAECAPCTAEPTRLRVRGPVVMAGYGNPDRRPGVGLDGDRFTTADRGCRGDDGALRIAGRADDVRVIAGRNVSLPEVEARVLAAPGVEAAVVLAEEDAVWGARLVLAYEGTLDTAALDTWCRQHLPGSERPRRLERLAALPIRPSGKYDRRALAERLGLSAA